MTSGAARKTSTTTQSNPAGEFHSILTHVSCFDRHREHVLFIANYTKLYRHSFYADYFVFNVADKTTVPLVVDQVGGECIGAPLLRSN